MAAWTEASREILDGIRRRAGESDQSGAWPQEDLAALTSAGAMRWTVPAEFGGDGISPLELHLRYEQVASASVATALILSQRDSAVDLIASAEPSAARDELIARLVTGEIFSTVGIAQLTTSRQGGAPALLARRESEGYRLNGVMPWATGAAKADYIVSGAPLAGDAQGRQILFALPRDLPGVSVEPPMPLVALRSTWTSQVNCADVYLEDRFILRGPVDRALGARRKGLALAQTFIAMGLIRSAIDLIGQHDSPRAATARERLDSQLQMLRKEILALSAPGRETEATTASASIRGRCNDLALRATHAAITLYKGSALLATHPAQRLAREAMFLLVWSCPNPVIDCTVELLTDQPEPPPLSP